MATLTSGFGESNVGNAVATRSRVLSKTQTFDGTANNGAIGAVPLFTVTGAVQIDQIVPVCLTTLNGAGGTFALGVVGATTLLIAATNTSALAAGTIWVDTAPDVGGVAIPSGLKNIVVIANVIATVITVAVDAGVMRFDVLWRPISPDGNLS